MDTGPYPCRRIGISAALGLFVVIVPLSLQIQRHLSLTGKDNDTDVVIYTCRPTRHVRKMQKKKKTEIRKDLSEKGGNPMAITQLSAFLENTPGTLYKAITAISGAGINIRALSVADTRDFGILRVIVSDIDKTIEILSDDTVVTRTQVIAVRMSDKAGALREILSVLQEAGINIEYVYAFTANAANSAYVVLRVNDIEEAEAILAKNGQQTLSDKDLNTILP